MFKRQTRGCENQRRNTKPTQEDMGGPRAGGGLRLGPLALGSAGRLSLPQRAAGEGPGSPALILKPVVPTDQLVLAMPG